MSVRLNSRLALFLATTVATFYASLDRREQQLIERWLICIECDAALDSLRALGGRKPQETADALNTALQRGPEPGRLASAESALGISYRRDSSYRVWKGLPLPQVRSAYVLEGRRRFENGYRARAAVGLGWLRTPRSRAYLDSAASRPFAPSVKQAIVYARDSMP